MPRPRLRKESNEFFEETKKRINKAQKRFTVKRNRTNLLFSLSLSQVKRRNEEEEIYGVTLHFENGK